VALIFTRYLTRSVHHRLPAAEVRRIFGPALRAALHAAPEPIRWQSEAGGAGN